MRAPVMAQAALDNVRASVFDQSGLALAWRAVVRRAEQLRAERRADAEPHVQGDRGGSPGGAP
ncbi:MAG: hypothetical protein ACYCVV_19835 [Acidimicrobiales bacterium]